MSEHDVSTEPRGDVVGLLPGDLVSRDTLRAAGLSGLRLGSGPVAALVAAKPSTCTSPTPAECDGD